MWCVIALCSLWLWSCGNSNGTLGAVLTFKRDGSHFTGIVVRREANSITLTAPDGSAHTFLYTELSNIEYTTPDVKNETAADSKGKADTGSATADSAPGGAGAAQAPAPASAAAKSDASASAAAVPSGGIHFAEGTEIAIRTFGVIDSCCFPAGSTSSATFDADVKGAGGKVLIPEGAHALLKVREQQITEDRVWMTFELSTADFGGKHYVFECDKSELDPGFTLVIKGAKMGSPEAKLRGVNVHIDDSSYLSFKAVAPTTLKPSL